MSAPRGGTDNNGRNYTGTKDGERRSIEADEPGGAISVRTRCNADFDREVAGAEYDCAPETFESIQIEIVRKNP